MDADSRRARYELTTRHALAVVGVIGAEIHLCPSPGGEPELVAQSVASQQDSSIGLPLDEALRPFVDPRSSASFFHRVLTEPGVHQQPVTTVRLGGGREEVSLGQDLGRMSHLVAARMEPSPKTRGLMLFALDHEARRGELAALKDFVAQAQRISDLEAAGQLEPTLQSSYRLDAVLQLVRSTLLRGDLEATLQAIVENLQKLFSADLVAIMLVDREEGMLRPAAGVFSDLRAEELYERKRDTLPTDAGVTGWVARNRRPALIPDAREDPRAGGRTRSVAESIIAAPLMANGNLIGVLRVGAFGSNRFGANDVRLIEALASQSAMIVENARLRDEMRRQNERLAILARLVESSGDAIIFVDPEMSVAEFNPAAAALFEQGEEEILGEPILGLMSDANPPELLASLEVGIRESGEWRGEVEARTAGRESFPAEVRVSPVCNDEGQRIGSVAVVRDLTERKLLEEQVIQSEKLRSLGVMAGGVAHHVNNTLASVLGHADLLLQIVGDSPARPYLEAIAQAAEDGAAAVRRITEFARPRSSSQLSPVDLVNVAHDVVTATAPLWRDQAQRQGRPITVTVEAAGPAWIMASTPELREALTNLVLNAADAMPSGGSIRIRIGEDREWVWLKVIDSGIGMSEEVRTRIFDPFFTTKPFGSGTGLGLALARSIVGHHGGTIRVDSTLGEGTTFTIELPASKPAAAKDGEVEGFLATRVQRILLVEDEPAQLNLLRTILSPDGHQITACASGSEAIATLDEQEFDLVITDLGLPGVDGWEVAQAAKARLPGVRVAMASGWTGELEDSSDLTDRGVDLLVRKPYRIQAIRDAVHKAGLPLATERPALGHR